MSKNIENVTLTVVILLKAFEFIGITIMMATMILMYLCMIF